MKYAIVSTKTGRVAHYYASAILASRALRWWNECSGFGNIFIPKELD
jgi:hypothetical protein